MKFVPTEGKILLQAKKLYKKEKKKPVLDSEGNPLYDLVEFRVAETTSKDIKKGKIVATIFRGGVQIPEMETKTHSFLVVDKEDVYAVQV